MNWLPQDYKAPNAANDYLKLQDGDNKFRILSQPIYGWEDWIDEKPVRYRMENKPESSHDSSKPMKHFWSFIVWNYIEERIQIMNITQATIRKSLQSLCESEDWGNPCYYDIKISKKGEKIKTEYVVTPLPGKPLAANIKQAFNDKPCQLEALFEGADPFAKWMSYTPGVFGEVQGNLITNQQFMEIHSILGYCDPKYKKDIMESLKSKYGISDLKELTPEIFDKLKTQSIINRNAHQDKMAAMEDPFSEAMHA